MQQMYGFAVVVCLLLGSFYVHFSWNYVLMSACSLLFLIACSTAGPRRYHNPVRLTLESINTFKNSMCLYPKRSVGTVVLPMNAITSGYTDHRRD